ncbi:MAG: arginase family protein [Chloroflexi bacterium]|nr:arginase family protein [Chloroflexota bacterium]
MRGGKVLPVLAIIGAPSSAGAHGPGQEKAPESFRAAGLLQLLEERGFPVVDRGDLSLVRFRPDPMHRRAQSLERVVRVARAVASEVNASLRAGQMPLVIGGDCTITLGVIAGFLEHGVDPGLLYMDGGMDVGTPATYRPGMFDSMGVAHMVAEPGAAEALTRVGPRAPLLPGRQIVPYGYTPGEPVAPEQAILDRNGIVGFPVDRVLGRAAAAASEALREVTERVERLVVHFDVDVIDFVDFPASDVPHINTGLTLAEVMTSLGVFAASPHFAGLVITEFNPDHDDEEGTLARIFTRALADALAFGHQQSRPDAIAQ